VENVVFEGNLLKPWEGISRNKGIETSKLAGVDN
jgi:hypothetical protein